MNFENDFQFKYVLWGFGKLGKLALKTFGENRVAGIIDSGMEEGKYIGSVPVISFDTYKEQYRQFPIYITPRFHENEIVNRLENSGIGNYILNSEAYGLMQGIASISNIDIFLDKFKNDKRIIIYGDLGVCLLLAEYLANAGKTFEVVIYEPNEKNNEIIELLRDNEQEDNLVICTQKTCVHDLCEKDLSKCDMIFVEDIVNQKEFYYRDNLKKFHNIHTSKRCFIVATGPSLKIEDLDKLHRSMDCCISVNGIVDAFDKTKWTPDYYVLSDIDAKEKYYEIATKKQGIEIFLSDNIVNDDKEDEANIYHIKIALASGNTLQFSDDFSGMAYAGSTVVYVALQLAAYMGFDDIYLLGVDCNYKKDSKSNYFLEKKEVDRANHDVETMIDAFKTARKFADSHGIHIYNATRGGMLEEFERVDFDSLFND